LPLSERETELLDIDKRIAKAIFGWEFKAPVHGWCCTCQRCGRDKDTCQYEGACDFSDNLGAAWLMVEKAIDYLAATTDMDQLTGMPTRHMWELWFGERGKANHGKGFGETAPEAICRAALKAVEQA
jgi:hypothetical protein